MATEPNKEIVVEDDRTGMSPETLERAVLDHLYYTALKDIPSATAHDVFEAVAHTVRDRLVQRWMHTNRTYYEQDCKRVYYLSAEYLLGRALAQNLINLGVYELTERMISKYGIGIGELLEQERDPGLGNGGLGRLAACFMDSLASLELPAVGYGIRYEFGIFDQGIEEGRQIERADDWLRTGNPWEHPRFDYAVPVHFYGRVDEHTDREGNLVVQWVDTQSVLGVPYDTPIAGFDNNTVNTLRLWSAKATKELNLKVFNDGDYRKAVEEKALSESISKVLYPNDRSPEGRELRLKQQYFFVCCSIADIIRRYKKEHDSFDAFPDKAAIQLNDTHPAVAVAELMRVLVDLEGLGWDRAWDITTRTIGYTNHTLLPEALEKWPVWMFERLLPRHLTIIYEINRRFLREVHVRHPGNHQLQRALSIIEEGGEKQIRMAHLAVVGSHSVNGVAALHSELIKSQLMPEFYEFWPEKFNNKTNGVTPRRWLLQCNPKLSDAITARIGDGWVKNLKELEGLHAYVDDAEFHREIQEIKRHNKQLLADIIEDRNGVRVSVDSIFDVQVKRLHQYKRQLMNCLHIISLYWRLKDDPSLDIVPRTFIFGGKAAPGYWMAKQHIKLINDVAEIVNNDPIVDGRIRVVFVPNYNVSFAERIIPAADISEQISMAGKEASGTGNMKFSMNGALTVGTLDGANIEIREEVGAENFFLFGLIASEVKEVIRNGYNPSDYIEQSARLRRVIESIESGFFSPGEPDRFEAIVHDLRCEDDFLVCADFDAYVACHDEVDRIYRDQTEWTRRVIKNIASMGKFSSDRTIQQYADEIWGIARTPIALDE